MVAGNTIGLNAAGAARGFGTGVYVSGGANGNRIGASAADLRPAETISIGAGTSPRGIVVGDFNGDGKQDLVESELSGTLNDVRLLLGNGDGTFRIGHRAAGSEPGAAVRADGRRLQRRRQARSGRDAVRRQRVVEVLLGNGNGTFQAPVTYAGSARTRPE